MNTTNATKSINQIRGLMATRMHLRNATLQEQVAKAGRRLPKRVRRDLAVVVQAEVMGKSGKLSHQIDDAAVARAAKNAVFHLKMIDPKEVRTTAWVRWLAKVAFVLLAVFVATVWYFWSQGRI